MKNKTVNFLKNHGIFVLGLAFIAGIYFHYINITTHNIPAADHWQHLSNILPVLKNEGFSFSALVNIAGKYRDHNIVLTLVNMIINIKFFKYNTRVENFAGAAVLLVLSVVLYIFMVKKIDLRSAYRQVLALVIPLALFNYNQWEVATISFLYTFALRITITVLMFFWIDNCFFNKDKKLWKLLLCGVATFFTVAIVTSGYAAAVAGAIIVCYGWHVLAQEKSGMLKEAIRLIIIPAAAICGIIFYMIVFMRGESSITDDLVGAIFSVDIIKGLLVYLGAVLLPVTPATEHYYNHYAAGAVLLLFYVIAFIIFIVKKMYRKSLFPMMLFGYVAVNFFTIYMSRAVSFGFATMLSSRYVFESTIGIVGIIWIFAEFLSELDFEKLALKNKIPALAGVLVVFITISAMLVYSAKEEFVASPYRKGFFEHLEINARDLDAADLTDLEYLQTFQSPKEYVEPAVELMEEMGLSFFVNDPPAEQEAQEEPQEEQKPQEQEQQQEESEWSYGEAA